VRWVDESILCSMAVGQCKKQQNDETKLQYRVSEKYVWDFRISYLSKFRKKLRYLFFFLENM
jgi:hypothetical protein